MYCNKCGAIIDNEEQRICPNCNIDLLSVGTSIYPVDPLPMKWHKFLVYFSLILSFLLNLAAAFMFFFGLMYSTTGVDARTVYEYFPGIQIVDNVYGVITLFLAVFIAYVWWQLKGFKVNAPKYLLALYVLDFIFGVLYIVSVVLVTGSGVDLSVVGDILKNLISTVIYVWCTTVYYNKRSYMFKN